MKQEKIDELQALLDAGTPGEWRHDSNNDFIVSDDDTCIAQTWSKYEEDFPKAEANRVLIPALHNLAPALLEAARENLRLREERENWRVSSVCREKQLRIEELERETAKLMEALEESLALNINVFSDADAETCSYYSEHRNVIKQAKKALGKEPV